MSARSTCLLIDWARASGRRLAWMVAVDGLQTLIGVTMAGWLVILHAGQTTDAAGTLLLGYWALNLPALGEELGKRGGKE